MHNCFTGIFTAIIVYCKVVKKHFFDFISTYISNLFPPVTDDEHGDV